MKRLINRTRAKGQALVEFALAATVIFFLLGAAVDVGLIFVTFQELRVAAQEGATFGSYPVIVENQDGSVNRVDLRYTDIVERVRFSAGTEANGFADLLDLNGDDQDDADQGLLGNGRNVNGYIYIENLRDANNDGDPSNDNGATCRTNVARTEMRNAARGCYIRVSLRYDYQLLFPLLPAFADTIPLRVSYILKIRSSFIG